MKWTSYCTHDAAPTSRHPYQLEQPRAKAGKTAFVSHDAMFFKASLESRPWTEAGLLPQEHDVVIIAEDAVTKPLQ